MLKVTESLPLKSALKFNPSMEIFYGTLALDSHDQKAVILIVRAGNSNCPYTDPEYSAFRR